MTLIERTPNLMQRLSRLPTTPQLALLHRRKPKPFTWPHATPPLERNLYEMVLHRPIETTRQIRHLRANTASRKVYQRLKMNPRKLASSDCYESGRDETDVCDRLSILTLVRHSAGHS